MNNVLVAKSVDIAREIYFAILLDRATAAPLIVASTEGGVEIEAVAEKSPEKIIRESIHPLAGLPAHSKRASWPSSSASSRRKSKTAAQLFDGLYRTFIGLRLLDGGGESARRHPTRARCWRSMRSSTLTTTRFTGTRRSRPCATSREEDPREVEASKHDLNYIGLDGNIACLVNGAGLAMATMDIIKFYGGSPANFLDVGGSATEEQVTEAFKILVGDKR